MNITQLIETPSAKRDSAWEQSFLNSFSESELYLRSDEPFLGPDGFSYMDVSTSEGAHKLKLEDFMSWCGHAGVGLVVNLKANKTPDYVFSYGMVWNYLLRQTFLNEEPEQSSPESDTLMVHKILEGYLPQYVRENIKDFLVSNKIEDTKIGLVSRGDKTAYEILWYFPKNKDLSENDQKALLESIAWFLPLDYKMALALQDDPSLHLENL